MKVLKQHLLSKITQKYPGTIGLIPRSIFESEKAVKYCLIDNFT